MRMDSESRKGWNVATKGAILKTGKAFRQLCVMHRLWSDVTCVNTPRSSIMSGNEVLGSGGTEAMPRSGRYLEVSDT